MSFDVCYKSIYKRNYIFNVPKNILNPIAIVLFILFVIDNIVSYSIITKLHLHTNKIVMDNTEEITKEGKGICFKPF